MFRLFYHEDAAAAVARGKEMRVNKRQVSVTHTLACNEADAVDGIDFMPDVPPFERRRLSKMFGIAEGAVLAPPPLMPPPPPNPLDSLPANWEKSAPTDDLKRIAAAANDGRAVENRVQAVEVIKQALAART